jgi:hypothetical protein
VVQVQVAGVVRPVSHVASLVAVVDSDSHDDVRHLIDRYFLHRIDLAFEISTLALDTAATPRTLCTSNQDFRAIQACNRGHSFAPIRQSRRGQVVFRIELRATPY